MSLVALYKCWSGEEWLRASVASILGGVDAVVLALSDVSWIGGRGNPSAKIAAELARKHSKVHVLAHDEPNQLAHCLHAYQWMQAHLPSEHVMLIDSDEVWDVAELLKAKAFLREHPEEMAYRTQMYTYIKRATLRVTPTEPLKPVCFVRGDLDDLGPEPRGCGIRPFVTMEDVYCHHFVFVRAHFNNVLEKLVQSHVSEKQPYTSMDQWIPRVWNRLPDYDRALCPDGFHPAIGFESNWQELAEVSRDQLPAVLAQHPNVFAFGRS